MSLAKLKDKGQVTIPASVRNQIEAQVGDVFEVAVLDGNIVLRPQTLAARSAGTTRPARKGIDIGRWIGVGKGTFGSVDEIDAFIRSERAQWD